MNFYWNTEVLIWFPHYAYKKKASLTMSFLPSLFKTFSLPKLVTLYNSPLHNMCRLKIIITIDKTQNSIMNITLIRKFILGKSENIF